MRLSASRVGSCSPQWPPAYRGHVSRAGAGARSHPSCLQPAPPERLGAPARCSEPAIPSEALPAPAALLSLLLVMVHTLLEPNEDLGRIKSTQNFGKSLPPPPLSSCLLAGKLQETTTTDSLFFVRRDAHKTRHSIHQITAGAPYSGFIPHASPKYSNDYS